MAHLNVKSSNLPKQALTATPVPLVPLFYNSSTLSQVYLDYNTVRRSSNMRLCVALVEPDINCMSLLVPDRYQTRCFHGTCARCSYADYHEYYS